ATKSPPTAIASLLPSFASATTSSSKLSTFRPPDPLVNLPTRTLGPLRSLDSMATMPSPVDSRIISLASTPCSMSLSSNPLSQIPSPVILLLLHLPSMMTKDILSILLPRSWIRNTITVGFVTSSTLFAGPATKALTGNLTGSPPPSTAQKKKLSLLFTLRTPTNPVPLILAQNIGIPADDTFFVFLF
ncbi:hypothetical protein M408DRAFT_170245, partial [Serendipita vermifera MAFF 305830]